MIHFATVLDCEVVYPLKYCTKRVRVRLLSLAGRERHAIRLRTLPDPYLHTYVAHIRCPQA